MAECPVFIDYESVRDGCTADTARVGDVRYRKRPPDSGCAHANAPGTPAGADHIDVVCLDCGMRWLRVKPWSEGR